MNGDKYDLIKELSIFENTYLKIAPGTPDWTAKARALTNGSVRLKSELSNETLDKHLRMSLIAQNGVKRLAR